MPAGDRLHNLSHEGPEQCQLLHPTPRVSACLRAPRTTAMRTAPAAAQGAAPCRGAAAPLKCSFQAPTAPCLAARVAGSSAGSAGAHHARHVASRLDGLPLGATSAELGKHEAVSCTCTCAAEGVTSRGGRACMQAATVCRQGRRRCGPPCFVTVRVPLTRACPNPTATRACAHVPAPAPRHACDAAC